MKYTWSLNWGFAQSIISGDIAVWLISNLNPSPCTRRAICFQQRFFYQSLTNGYSGHFTRSAIDSFRLSSTPFVTHFQVEFMAVNMSAEIILLGKVSLIYQLRVAMHLILYLGRWYVVNNIAFYFEIESDYIGSYIQRHKNFLTNANHVFSRKQRSVEVN